MGVDILIMKEVLVHERVSNLVDVVASLGERVKIVGLSNLLSDLDDELLREPQQRVYERRSYIYGSVVASNSSKPTCTRRI